MWGRIEVEKISQCLGAEDLAQSVKCMLGKGEDLSTVPPHPYKKKGVSACAHNPALGGEKVIPRARCPICACARARNLSEFSSSKVFQQKNRKHMDREFKHTRAPCLPTLYALFGP